MGRGGARPGAGRKPKSLQSLLLSNTFRPDRHAALLRPAPVGNVTPSRTTAATAEPPAFALAGLGPDGVRFVRAAFADFEFSALEVELLRLGAQCCDDAAQPRERGDVKQARSAGRQLLGVDCCGWGCLRRSVSDEATSTPCRRGGGVVARRSRALAGTGLVTIGGANTVGRIRSKCICSQVARFRRRLRILGGTIT